MQSVIMGKKAREWEKKKKGASGQDIKEQLLSICQEPR